MENLKDRISTIKTPTLIICGVDDPVTTIEDAHFMQSQITDSKLQSLPASHISNIEAEMEFNRAITHFFANLKSPHF